MKSARCVNGYGTKRRILGARVRERDTHERKEIGGHVRSVRFYRAKQRRRRRTRKIKRERRRIVGSSESTISRW